MHDTAGIDYKNYPTTWRKVKERLVTDEAGFIKELKEAWTNHA